eukprot:scaffold5781_cov124-Isochrysis_galbana.AAC.15
MAVEEPEEEESTGCYSLGSGGAVGDTVGCGGGVMVTWQQSIQGDRRGLGELGESERTGGLVA